jgi:lycopene beta-cyclase
VLVGGGLANGLIAWRLHSLPSVELTVVEREPTLGGNHTWSFHQNDVSRTGMADLRPFIVATWAKQSVHFPGHSRVFDVPYHAISSERLHHVLARTLGDRLVTDTDVVALSPDSVTLGDQRTIRARCVIDGRGPQRSAHLALGYQKFVGLEVETEEPHGETIAVIMDATVPQLGGYRFFYTLPFSPTRILIEDTYYTDGPDLDQGALTDRVYDYAARKGWRIRTVVREEKGILPVVLAGDMDRFWEPAAGDVPKVGLRASLFHPTTGYSLPDAAALAERLVTAPDLTSAGVQRLIEAHARRLWQDRAFFRLLNRLLFIAAGPTERVAVMERFYTLPGPLIERFFAAKLTLGDKAKIMIGRPPVPLVKAVGVIGEQPAWAFARRVGDGPR